VKNWSWTSDPWQSCVAVSVRYGLVLVVKSQIIGCEQVYVNCATACNKLSYLLDGYQFVFVEVITVTGKNENENEKEATKETMF
jgi:hypothetical protein